MSWLLLALVLYIDIAVRIFFGLGPWSPDLLVLAIACIALYFPLGQAYTMAFLYGMAWDAAYLDALGLHSLLFVVAVMITSRMRQILWARYAVSRLVIGFVLSACVRFGEVMYWLSNRDFEVLVSTAQTYVLYGAIVTGVCFFFLKWEPRPVQVPAKSPQVLFGER